MSVAQNVPAYTALRSGAGLHERTGWGVLQASGKDRLSFLHKYLTQDVQALAPGQGAEACALTVKGAMVAHLLLLARADDALLVLAPAARAPLLQHLSKYVLFDDVRFTDQSEALALLSLVGPRAAAVASQALAIEAPAGQLQHGARDEALLVRRDLGRLPGFDLIVPRGQVEALRAQLLAAGAVAADRETVEAVRIEEGLPEFGADLDERTIPIEAGLGGAAISTTKGCYTGQEVIARILHRGHVNRRLVGLRYPEGLDPTPGPLFAGDKEAGRVSSAARSPSLGGIGLALLHTKHAIGASLQLGAPGGPALSVVALPFPV